MLFETETSGLFGSARRGGDFETSALLTLLYLEYLAGAGGDAVSFASDIVSAHEYFADFRYCRKENSWRGVIVVVDGALGKTRDARMWRRDNFVATHATRSPRPCAISSKLGVFCADLPLQNLRRRCLVWAQVMMTRKRVAGESRGRLEHPGEGFGCDQSLGRA